MATISFRVSEEEKKIISEYSKKNNITVSEFLLSSVLSKIEDEEDYILGEQRMLDSDNKPNGSIRELAEKYGIDYDSL
ncbi:MAG: hypothetical protein KBA67_08035 [Leptotrichiaceae bacterium]|nr:hypothetical protein [Leptotrichiaceae bacterium]MBP7101459.1 hypothetical protein [Leptotrichiaceae bacterium]